MHNYQNQIPDLLENGIPVLIYAGDADFVCNWLGNQAWTLALGKAVWHSYYLPTELYGV
jgi:cathepsin A (carboxypeptidase C)